MRAVAAERQQQVAAAQGRPPCYGVPVALGATPVRSIAEACPLPATLAHFSARSSALPLSSPLSLPHLFIRAGVRNYKGTRAAGVDSLFAEDIV